MNFNYKNKQTWSFRKTTIGLFSVLLGVVSLKFSSTIAHADTVNSDEKLKVSQVGTETLNSRMSEIIDKKVESTNINSYDENSMDHSKSIEVSTENNVNPKRLNNANTINNYFDNNDGHGTSSFNDVTNVQKSNLLVSSEESQYEGKTTPLKLTTFQNNSTVNSILGMKLYSVSNRYSTGWHYDGSNNEWSYSKSDGKKANSEWVLINGSWYYFDWSGEMAANGWHGDNSGNKYYFDSNGHYLTNYWTYNGSSNEWKYAKVDGKQAQSEWVWINGSWYYFDWSGEMAANGWHGDNSGNKYYFDSNGHYLTNYWTYNGSSNEWKYAKADGKQAQSEWVWINGSWYYFDWSGEMAANGWHTDNNGNNYYFDLNGHYSA